MRLASCAAGLLAVGLISAPASAAVHAFPSAGSTVVGSVGFINSEEIGFFWSVGRGDRVLETFADPLSHVSQVIFDLEVISNNLAPTAFVNWDVQINGVSVGDFTVNTGQTGPFQVDLSFAPIAAVGGSYEVGIFVTNEVPGGDGSHTLAYAGNFAHSVTLVPEPASAGVLALGSLLGLRRRRL